MTKSSKHTVTNRTKGPLGFFEADSPGKPTMVAPEETRTLDLSEAEAASLADMQRVGQIGWSRGGKAVHEHVKTVEAPMTLDNILAFVTGFDPANRKPLIIDLAIKAGVDLTPDEDDLTDMMVTRLLGMPAFDARQIIVRIETMADLVVASDELGVTQPDTHVPAYMTEADLADAITAWKALNPDLVEKGEKAALGGQGGASGDDTTGGAAKPASGQETGRDSEGDDDSDLPDVDLATLDLKALRLYLDANEQTYAMSSNTETLRKQALEFQKGA
jgi:hypothetical protein